MQGTTQIHAVSPLNLEERDMGRGENQEASKSLTQKPSRDNDHWSQFSFEH